MKRPFEAVIEDVVVQPNKIEPIIVDFQHAELRDEEVKKMSCGLFRDKKENKTVLALSNGQVVYKGYKPDTEKQLMRKMLVLHNKRTGKVRLIEVQQWRVSPVLQKSVSKDSKDSVEKTAEEKIATLYKQFGSKRAKRQTELQERMKMSVNSVKDQLKKTASNVKINRLNLSTELPATKDMINAYLPTCNREATNVKDVYNVYEIIPRSKLETLYEHALEILNETIEGKPQFVIHTLKSIQSDPDKVYKAALLIYIETVNSWFATPLKDAKKRDVVICQLSEEVNAHIINTYSVPSANGRSRPNTVKDKALVHILILALTISDFTLDLELFRVMLSTRTALKKLINLAKIIGAVPDKKDKKIISLKVPLPVPMSLVVKKRAKRSNKQT